MEDGKGGSQPADGEKQKMDRNSPVVYGTLKEGEENSFK